MTIIPHLQMKKLRLREVNKFCENHSAVKRESQDLSLGILTFAACCPLVNSYSVFQANPNIPSSEGLLMALSLLVLPRPLVQVSAQRHVVWSAKNVALVPTLALN